MGTMTLFAFVVNAIVNAAGHPAWQALTIAVGGALFEDPTTVIVGILAAKGEISSAVAFPALGIGIFIGENLLFGMGRLARIYPFFRRLVDHERLTTLKEWVDQHIFSVVFITRFLPGFRLAIYFAYGFFGVPFIRFVVPSLLAVALWTGLLFILATFAASSVFEFLGVFRWPIVLLAILGFYIAGHLHFRRVMNEKS